MKPEQKLTARYADLLTESSDDDLNILVRELDTAYTTPKRPEELTWAAAVTSVQGQHQRLALVPQQPLNAEIRFRGPLRLYEKLGREKALLAVAAIVTVVLLSAALLGTIGASWFWQSHGTQPSPSSSGVDALLLQDLLKSNGTPANIRQLALDGQFTRVHLTTGTGHVTIQEAYADANNVVLIYTVDQSTWNTATSCSSSPLANQSNQCGSEPVLTVTTSEKQTLPENFERVNMGKEPVYQNQQFAVLAYYDASSIQGNPKPLHLTVSLSKKVSQSQEKIGMLTVPFHADKTVITVKQTATVHGDALTLERVVMTPTEIRFYNTGMSSSRLEGVGLFPTGLSIAGTNYDANPFPSDAEDPNTYGWFGQRSSNFVSFYDSLQHHTGTWIVTEWGRVWTDTSFEDSHADSWTFTFNVS